jgi:hypothetical protein
MQKSTHSWASDSFPLSTCWAQQGGLNFQTSGANIFVDLEMSYDGTPKNQDRVNFHPIKH